MDMVMPEIRNGDTDSEEFAAKAKVLKDLIEYHAEEEEKRMFPKARKSMGTPDCAKWAKNYKSERRNSRAACGDAPSVQSQDAPALPRLTIAAVYDRR